MSSGKVRVIHDTADIEEYASEAPLVSVDEEKVAAESVGVADQESNSNLVSFVGVRSREVEAIRDTVDIKESTFRVRW